MNPTILIVLSLLSSCSAFSQEKKVILAPPASPAQGSDALLKGWSPNLLEGRGASGVKVTSTCKDSQGQIHQPDAPGYEGCMRSSQKTPQQPLSGGGKKDQGPALGVSLGN